MRRTGLAIILCGLLLAPAAARAQVNLSLGVTAWVAWWDAWWARESYIHSTIAPNALYGPTLVLQLPDHWTMAAQFLYGRFRAEAAANSLVSNNGQPFIVPLRERRIIERYDIDYSLARSFTRFFRLFVGFKYGKYDHHGRHRTALDTTLMIALDEKKYQEFAPALGVSFTIRLVKTLYLLINGSVVYNYTTIKQRNTMVSLSGTGSMVLPTYDSFKQQRLGANGQLGLAYFIAPAKVTLSLGGRYQMLKVLASTSTSDPGVGRYEHIWGVTVAAGYRWEIVKRSVEEGR